MQQILLLHGAIGSEEQLRPLRDQLASLQYEVHSFNFSGHDGRSISKPISMELFAEETLAYINNHELKNPYVFGYSMGGYVAMYLSALYPGLIQKIITLGTKYEWSPEIAAKEVKMLRPEIIEEKIPAFAAALARRHGDANWKNLLHATADMLLQLGNHPLLNRAQLEKISSEVLLLIGDKDNMVSLKETTDTAQQLQKGSVEILSNTAHPVEQIDIKMLSGKILSFFFSVAL